MGRTPTRLRALLLSIAVVVAGRAAADPPIDEESGRIHYEAGRRFYEAGRYREALHEFDDAYEASGRSALLYNMGRCHEQIGEPKQALRAYRDFLRGGANPDETALVQARVEALERELREHEEPVRARAVAPMRKYPFVLAGFSLALFATSIGTGVGALQVRDRLSAGCPDDQCPPNYTDAGADRDLGKRLAITTDVLVGVASALSVATIVTIVIEARKARR